GALDRAAGQLRWTVLAVEGRRHGAQTIPETASPDLVRRQPSRCAAARHQARPRLLRCGVVHHETVRRAGADRAAGARRGAAGRDAATFRIGKRVYIAVDDDAERARRRVGDSLQRFYPFFQSHHLEAFPVYGPPDACVRGLREVAEAGAELILLNPVFDEAKQ